MATRTQFPRLLQDGVRLLRCERNSNRNSRRFNHHIPQDPRFGLLFDIDGVLTRGRTPIPAAKHAFSKLVDSQGRFKLPVVFVTNAGNTLRQNKARQLSELLEVQVDPEQVVLSHSPLKMFRQFHDKHVLVSGQGPIIEIAKNLGFTKVTDVDTLRNRFPLLDMVDHKRRKHAPCAFEQYFPRIEAVVLFGEPVRWETNLQLILDVLLTDGRPCYLPKEVPDPHMPILACNMDLMWMAEAPMPRFGHGMFLQCLESVYNKITGKEMKYTGLIGKPSDITYHHAEHVVETQAQQLGLKQVRTIYAIGDNPEADIYGANLFNKYLQKKVAKARAKKAAQKAMRQVELEGTVTAVVEEVGEDVPDVLGCEACESILVHTGVYRPNMEETQERNAYRANHNGHVHRDFKLDPELKKPAYEAEDVDVAIDMIFKVESAH
ncbi:haloacid dehalogenase-like hydrolase domain-containing 5 [Branchiostoma floridae x Branchiostoma japonicum]